jgi:hypothetical protein
MMRLKPFLLFLISITLMTGCSLRNKPIDTTKTSISIEVPPTKTIKPVAFITPTILPSKQILSVTPTLLKPTISLDQQKSIVEAMFNNPICSLPCWWGITPGITEWSEAEKILNMMGISPEKYNSYTVNENSEEVTYDNYEIRYETTKETIERFSLHVRKTTVNVLSISFIESFENYSIHNILKGYGKPSEILIYTNEYSLGDGALPFSTVLIYENERFIVDYREQGEVEGNYVKACIAHTIPAIQIFSSFFPNELLLSHPYERFEEHKIAKTIEEATGMTVEAFYNQYLNASDEICIQTLAELWSQDIDQ